MMDKIVILIYVFHSLFLDSVFSQTDGIYAKCANDKFDKKLCHDNELIMIESAEYGLSECEDSCCLDRPKCLVKMPKNHHWDEIRDKCHKENEKCYDLYAQIQYIGDECEHGDYNDFVRIYYSCEEDDDDYIGPIVAGVTAGFVILVLICHCVKTYVKKKMHDRGVRMRDLALIRCCMKVRVFIDPVDIHVKDEDDTKKLQQKDAANTEENKIEMKVTNEPTATNVTSENEEHPRNEKVHDRGSRHKRSSKKSHHHHHHHHHHRRESKDRSQQIPVEPDDQRHSTSF